MAKASWCGQAAYDLGHRFIVDCIAGGGSLLAPGESVWTEEALAEAGATAGANDYGEGTFIEKLVQQIHGTEPETVRLVAEALLMILVSESDTSPEKAREHLERVLALVSDRPVPPEEVSEALEAGGVAKFGAAKARRDAYLRFVIKLGQRAGELDATTRAQLGADPWALRDLTASVRTSTDAMIANALLHLAFPDTFEYMISEAHRSELIEAFSDVPEVENAAPDPEHALLAIRELIGAQVNLYGEPFQRVWKEQNSAGWRGAVELGARLYEDDQFDELERDYKVEVAAQLVPVRDALFASEEWLADFAKVMRSSKANIVSWQAADKFVKWCEEHPQDAEQALRELWAEEGDWTSRLSGFLDATPRDAVAGSGTRASLASFLLFAVDVTTYPAFKPSVTSTFQRAIGREPHAFKLEIDPERRYRPDQLASSLGVDARRVRRWLRQRYPRDADTKGSSWDLSAEQAREVIEGLGGEAEGSSEVARYGEWVDLLDELRFRLLAHGLPLRDRLDAQSIAYWLARADPPEDWDEQSSRRFLAWRDAGEPDIPVVDSQPGESAALALPRVTEELASELFLPRGWLDTLVGLLEQQRQIILYGPPGTGKTFVARRLARHLTANGGATELVQFHPSYTYEDFFEGYRPVTDGDGRLTYKLTPGVLKRLAEAAQEDPGNPYILVVDEINRGNLAKIFGELYFLLEYRKERIQLQYSHEEFHLPENLFLIGTMNTADRSIALVDTALRRRFRFVEMHPKRKPVSEMLERWLRHHGHALDAADLLTALNARIADEEFALGPAYLMSQDGSAPDIDEIWQFAILPQLAERFYPRSIDDLEREYGVQALSEALSRSADEDEPDDGGTDAPDRD